MLTHGVPWEIATTMPDDARAAWTIAIGNMEMPEDKQFDWGSMQFPSLS